MFVPCFISSGWLTINTVDIFVYNYYRGKSDKMYPRVRCTPSDFIRNRQITCLNFMRSCELYHNDIIIKI